MTINLPLILLLAALHLSIGYWRWPKAISVFPWSAIAGGIAIAYVFLDLLPALSKAEVTFTHSRLHSMQGLYLVSLLGLLLIHGLHAQMRPALAFKVAILSNATSNFLFSYLLNHTSQTLKGASGEGQAVAIAVIQAFLAGSIILNVLTDELPEANQDKLLPFTASALGYAAILFVA